MVTAHFTADEFRSHDGEPYPPEWIPQRLYPLCCVLEALRAELGGRPIWITSGYRSPAHNAAVGGALRSQHMQGRAADITVEGIAPSDVHAAALRLFSAGRLPLLGGLGLYPGWVHVDVRPRILGRIAQWTGAGIGSEIPA